MVDKDAAFLSWLEAEGASFPSIEWPSSKTESGIRGAIAKEDIGKFHRIAPSLWPSKNASFPDRTKR